MHLKPAIGAFAVGIEALFDQLPDLLRLIGVKAIDKVIEFGGLVDIYLLLGLRDIA